MGFGNTVPQRESLKASEVPLLVQRDVIRMDRTRAENYRPGDVLRYVRENQNLGVAGKSYATVSTLMVWRTS